jgi:hypothetical protein
MTTGRRSPDTSHVILRPAGPGDEPQIRRLLTEVASGGDISLRIEKEPDYFAASRVEGHPHDVLVGEDPGTNRIIGTGAMSEKSCFFNGQSDGVPLGYLSNLRIDKNYRSGDLLDRGYNQLEQMHKPRAAKLYLTTIMEDNVVARRALTSGRPGLPAYQDFGRLTTFVLGTWKNLFACRKKQGPKICNATEQPLTDILEFWNKEGRHSQFFPAYTSGDLTDPDGLLAGLGVENIYLAMQAGQIVGTLALWDQRPFRQWVIDSYSRRASLARPIYNGWARLTGRPTLPSAGQHLNYRFIGLTCVKDRSRVVFESLLAHVWRQVMEQDRGAMVMCALHESDPLAPALQQQPHVPFNSRLYIVHWPDGQHAFTSLDKTLPPYVELGSL